MRILLLCTDAFGGHGGIALYTRDLVTALAADTRCKEVVVVPRIIRHELEPLPPKVTFITESARGVISYLRTTARLRRELFDLVICGHINLMPAARALSPNPLLFIYGIEAWRPVRRAQPLLDSCCGVVSISDVTLRRFRDWSSFTGASHLLPNAIHLEQYRVAPKDPGAVQRYRVEGKRVLMTFGRLAGEERYKGFDEVLEILQSLPADVVYIVAGDGEDAERLRSKTRDLGLADRVVFTGFIREDEKAALYSIADVYVMPSRGEGFGFVLLEAMACGIPTIASKHDGGREALRNGLLGTLVDPTSPAEIRAAIIDALEIGTHLRPKGLEHFAFDRFVERTRAIIDDVMGVKQ